MQPPKPGELDISSCQFNSDAPITGPSTGPELQQQKIEGCIPKCSPECRPHGNHKVPQEAASINVIVRGGDSQSNRVVDKGHPKQGNKEETKYPSKFEPTHELWAL